MMNWFDAPPHMHEWVYLSDRRESVCVIAEKSWLSPTRNLNSMDLRRLDVVLNLILAKTG